MTRTEDAGKLGRRGVLGLGAAASAGVAAGVAFGTGPAWAEEFSADTLSRLAPRQRIRKVYDVQSAQASGVWSARVSVAGDTAPIVDRDASTVVEAYSVNKIPVAVTVLDKVARGKLKLTDRVELDAAIVVPDDDDGYFYLDSAYPSSITLGHVLTAMLSQSDNTAVRLSARALATVLEPGEATAAQAVNQLMVRKGYPKTQVQQKFDAEGKPVIDRFFLGWTTAQETHDLLVTLSMGRLLGAESTAFLLRILRSPAAMTDGIRRAMSSMERKRIATKGGWFKEEDDEKLDGRNEAGVIFDPAGVPVLTYSLFAHGPFVRSRPDQQQANRDNFGATHPALEARAVMGRVWLNAVDELLAGPADQAPKRARPQHGATPPGRPRSAAKGG